MDRMEVDDRLTIVKMDRMVAIMRRSFSVAGKQGCRMYTRGGERRGVGGARASEPVLKRDVRAAPVVSRPSNSSSTASHPPATSARHGGKKGSVFASYKALPYNTKLVFCSCAAMFAALGLLVADKLEDLFPAHNHRTPSSPTTSSPKSIQHTADTPQTPTDTNDPKPKLFSISVVDRS